MGTSRTVGGKPSLQETFSSVYWEVVADHLIERSATIMSKLKSCSPEQLPMLQGRLKEIESLLALPEQQHAQRKQKGEQ